MQKITPKNYEKIDESTIRIVAEKIDDVDINVISQNKEVMESQVKELEDKLTVTKQRLKYITDILEEAKKVGVKPTPKKTDKTSSDKK